MLDAAIRDRASTLIQERLRSRDDQLKADLGRFVEKLERIEDDDEILRMSVKLRLLCETDLTDRAALIWNSVRAAHRDLVGLRTEGLVRDMKDELNVHMRSGGVALAAAMRERAGGLRPIFSGPQPIDAAWLARQRDRAAEQTTKNIEEYVDGLSWGFGSLLRRILKNIQT